MHVCVCVCCCLANICRGLAKRYSPGCSSWITVRKSTRLERECISQTVSQVSTASAVICWFWFTGGWCSRTIQQGWHCWRLGPYDRLHNAFLNKKTDLHDLRESDKSFDDTNTVCNGWFRIKTFQNSKQNSCFSNLGNLRKSTNVIKWQKQMSVCVCVCAHLCICQSVGP